MAKQKSPFIGLTTQEVNRAERDSFVIIIGNDFYNKDGEYVYSLSQAEKYYEILLENILYTIESGSAKQRNAAIKCLENLHIRPLRLQ